jgi:hypothetical protein
MNGNDFGADFAVGRYDALNGLVLKGDGKGYFRALSILQSGDLHFGRWMAMLRLATKI